MNTKGALLAGIGVLILASTASADPFQGLSVELANSGAEGNTYRIFANLDTGARIDAVYGNAQGDLSIATANGGTIYHIANGVDGD